jgi:hypothetical protein
VSKTSEFWPGANFRPRPEEALHAGNPDDVERIFLGATDYLKILYSNQISHTVCLFLRLIFPFLLLSCCSSYDTLWNGC